MSAVWCTIQAPRRAVPGVAPPERCVAAPRRGGGVPHPAPAALPGLRGTAGARTGALALGAAAAAACRAARPRRGARRRRCRRRRLALVEDLTQVVDEALNTLEDASLHINRITPWLSGPSADTAAPVQGKRRVVILGTGWAAHAIAKVIDTSANDVCVVSPRNYFVFTPMLAAASVGTVEYRSILEHIRSSNPTLRFYQGVCEAIDVDRHEITVGPAPEHDRTLGPEHTATGRPDGERFAMPYDVLVTAVGVRPSSLDVPGVSDHCLFLKDIPDANNIRKRVTECFERADLPTASEQDKRRLLTFVVVGGGPTGCEFSGELSDFVRNDLQRFYPKLAPLVRILLVHRGKAVLPAFGEQLQALATTTLREQGIEVLTSAKVTCVTADSITLAAEDRSETVPCGLAVWAAGQVGQDIVAALRRQVPAQLAGASKDASKLIVDDWLRVIGVPDGSIIALGDCARIAGLEPALPQTAQVAAQQGAYVARLLNRCYELSLDAPPRLPPDAELPVLARARGQAEAPRFRFFNLGQLAYLGQSQAVAEVDLGSTKVSQAGGRAAFLLWRSVYVVKQVSFRNRVLVLFDWFKSRIFGRDFTRF